MGTHTQKKVDPEKTILVFAIGKYVKDVKQGQKVDPYLVESIVRPPGLVKERLRRISMKMSALFGCPENQQIPTRDQHSKPA